MIKAAFLYDMARSTQWPSSAGPAIEFCIYGSDPFGQSAGVIDGQPVHARVLEVRAGIEMDEAGSCDILFIGSSAADEVPELLAATQGRSILTVSELPDFTKQGGMVRLKEVDNRLRFDLNLTAVWRAGLEVRSDTLELADSVTTKAADAQVR